MAVTADTVIVELEARMDRYNRNIIGAGRTWDRFSTQMRGQTRAVEDQIRRSSTEIGNQFRGLAAAAASAFSVQAITRLADTWTRFSNSLMVAGLQGEQLIDVQERLREVANRNGIQLEAVGTLYNRAAISADALGASQEDIIRFTNAVASALRIQGTSAQAASGAITQLGQALASPRVEMEEFGSVLDGMLPLVQEMAKRVEGAGGTVAGLRSLIRDRQGAGLSNTSMFAAIMDSVDTLEERASSAQLTIGNSFTVLGNELARYIGLADDSFSATEKISMALRSIADNLDTIVPALAVLVTMIGARYTAAVIAATAATVRKSLALSASNAAAARMAATSQWLATTYGLQTAAVNTSSVALSRWTAVTAGAGAAAASTGRLMLAAFGGPVGVAVAALATGIYFLSGSLNDLDEAVDAVNGSFDEAKAKLEEARNRAERAGVAVDKLRNETSKAHPVIIGIAGALDQASEAARAYATNARIAAIASARLRLAKAEDEGEELVRQQNRRNPRLNPLAGVFSVYDRVVGNPSANTVQAALENNRATKAMIREEIRLLEATPEGAFDEPDGPPRSTAPDPGSKKTTRQQGRRGPSPEDIARRFESDLDRFTADVVRTTAELAQTRQARVEAELALIEMEREANERDIRANEDYNAAQRQALIEANNRAAEGHRNVVLMEEANRIAEDAVEAASASYRLESEIVEAQRPFARTAKARLALEIELLQLAEAEERNRLDAVIASGETSEVEKKIAEERRKHLATLYSLRRKEAEERNRSPAEVYIDGVNWTPEELNEEFERIAIDGLERFNDSLTDAIMGAGSLQDAFKDLATSIIRDLMRIAIQQAIIKPLAESLFGESGSGGAIGGIGSFLGGLLGIRPGKRSGGHVQAGQLYPVGEDGIELFKAPVSGKIIPNGQLRAAGSGAAPAVVRVEVAGSELFDVRVSRIAGDVSVQTVTAAAPVLVDGAASETFRRLSRPKL